jgi:hypothetical protein
MNVQELLNLFAMKELSIKELKVAKKKVLLLHPDKNTKDTTEHYLYFKNAYEKLCQTYAYIHHETDEHNFKEHDIDKTFKEFIEKKGYTPSKNKEMYLKYFNEMFENVHIKDEDGYQEWLKSEQDMYDKNDLEKSRKKLISDIVKIETVESGSFGNYYSDVKEAHMNTIIGIDQEKLYGEKRKFKSVEELQRHRADIGKMLSEQESLQQLKEKEENEKNESIHQSYEWLKKEEEMKTRNKNYVSKFLMLSSK